MCREMMCKQTFAKCTRTFMSMSQNSQNFLQPTVHQYFPCYVIALAGNTTLVKQPDISVRHTLTS